jgi:hypothetical protein
MAIASRETGGQILGEEDWVIVTPKAAGIYRRVQILSECQFAVLANSRF